MGRKIVSQNSVFIENCFDTWWFSETLTSRHIKIEILNLAFTDLPKISSNSPTPLNCSVSYINLEEKQTFNEKLNIQCQQTYVLSSIFSASTFSAND